MSACTSIGEKHQTAGTDLHCSPETSRVGDEPSSSTAAAPFNPQVTCGDRICQALEYLGYIDEQGSLVQDAVPIDPIPPLDAASLEQVQIFLSQEVHLLEPFCNGKVTCTLQGYLAFLLEVIEGDFTIELIDPFGEVLFSSKYHEKMQAQIDSYLPSLPTSSSVVKKGVLIRCISSQLTKDALIQIQKKLGGTPLKGMKIPGETPEQEWVRECGADFSSEHATEITIQGTQGSSIPLVITNSQKPPFPFQGFSLAVSLESLIAGASRPKLYPHSTFGKKDAAGVWQPFVDQWMQKIHFSALLDGKGLALLCSAFSRGLTCSLTETIETSIENFLRSFSGKVCPTIMLAAHLKWCLDRYHGKDPADAFALTFHAHLLFQKHIDSRVLPFLWKQMSPYFSPKEGLLGRLGCKLAAGTSFDKLFSSLQGGALFHLCCEKGASLTTHLKKPSIVWDFSGTSLIFPIDAHGWHTPPEIPELLELTPIPEHLRSDRSLTYLKEHYRKEVWNLLLDQGLEKSTSRNRNIRKWGCSITLLATFLLKTSAMEKTLILSLPSVLELYTTSEEKSAYIRTLGKVCPNIDSYLFMQATRIAETKKISETRFSIEWMHQLVSFGYEEIALILWERFSKESSSRELQDAGTQLLHALSRRSLAKGIEFWGSLIRKRVYSVDHQIEQFHTLLEQVLTYRGDERFLALLSQLENQVTKLPNWRYGHRKARSKNDVATPLTEGYFRLIRVWIDLGEHGQALKSFQQGIERKWVAPRQLSTGHMALELLEGLLKEDTPLCEEVNAVFSFAQRKCMWDAREIRGRVAAFIEAWILKLQASEQSSDGVRSYLEQLKKYQTSFPSDRIYPIVQAFAFQEVTKTLWLDCLNPIDQAKIQATALEGYLENGEIKEACEKYHHLLSLPSDQTESLELLVLGRGVLKALTASIAMEPAWCLNQLIQLWREKIFLNLLKDEPEIHVDFWSHTIEFASHLPLEVHHRMLSSLLSEAIKQLISLDNALPKKRETFEQLVDTLSSLWHPERRYPKDLVNVLEKYHTQLFEHLEAYDDFTRIIRFSTVWVHDNRVIAPNKAALFVCRALVQQLKAFPDSCSAIECLVKHLFQKSGEEKEHLLPLFSIFLDSLLQLGSVPVFLKWVQDLKEHFSKTLLQQRLKEWVTWLSDQENFPQAVALIQTIPECFSHLDRAEQNGLLYLLEGKVSELAFYTLVVDFFDPNHDRYKWREKVALFVARGSGLSSGQSYSLLKRFHIVNSNSWTRSIERCPDDEIYAAWQAFEVAEERGIFNRYPKARAHVLWHLVSKMDKVKEPLLERKMEDPTYFATILREGDATLYLQATWQIALQQTLSAIQKPHEEKERIQRLLAFFQKGKDYDRALEPTPGSFTAQFQVDLTKLYINSQSFEQFYTGCMKLAQMRENPPPDFVDLIETALIQGTQFEPLLKKGGVEKFSAFTDFFALLSTEPNKKACELVQALAAYPSAMAQMTALGLLHGIFLKFMDESQEDLFALPVARDALNALISSTIRHPEPKVIIRVKFILSLTICKKFLSPAQIQYYWNLICLEELLRVTKSLQEPITEVNRIEKLQACIKVAREFIKRFRLIEGDDGHCWLCVSRFTDFLHQLHLKLDGGFHAGALFKDLYYSCIEQDSLSKRREWSGAMILHIGNGDGGQNLGIELVRKTCCVFSKNGLKLVLLFLETFLQKDYALFETLPESSLNSRRFIQGMLIALVSKLSFKGAVTGEVLTHIVRLFCLSVMPQDHPIFRTQGDQIITLLSSDKLLRSANVNPLIHVMAHLVFRSKSKAPAPVQSMVLIQLIEELQKYRTHGAFSFVMRLSQQTQTVIQKDRRFRSKYQELLKVYDQLLSYFEKVPFDPSMIEEVKLLFFPNDKPLFPKSLCSQAAERYNRFLTLVKEKEGFSDVEAYFNGLHVLPNLSASPSSPSRAASSALSPKRGNKRKGRRRRK